MGGDIERSEFLATRRRVLRGLTGERLPRLARERTVGPGDIGVSLILDGIVEAVKIRRSVLRDSACRSWSQV